jgi:hypothetical protein
MDPSPGRRACAEFPGGLSSADRGAAAVLRIKAVNPHLLPPAGIEQAPNPLYLRI